TSDAAATGSAVTQPSVSEATTRSEGPLLGRRRSAPSVGPRAPGPLTPQAAASALGGSQASTTGAGHELDVLGSTAAATTPTPADAATNAGQPSGQLQLAAAHEAADTRERLQERLGELPPPAAGNYRDSANQAHQALIDHAPNARSGISAVAKEMLTIGIAGTG